MTLDPDEIRDMSESEIEATVQELGAELFALEAKRKSTWGAAGGGVEGDDYAAIKNTKKDIARLKTIRRERELEDGRP